MSVEVLRRVYIRARGMTMAGSRVVTLGKQLEEACLRRDPGLDSVCQPAFLSP